MFVWFLACGVLAVAYVFDSSGVDYRFVAAGSVLPLAENLTGSPWVLHTLIGSVVLLAAVMAATTGRGRRLLRRRWLGLPIGTFVFLAASGSWSRAELFWWPLGGDGGVGHGVAPELGWPLAAVLALEALGLLGIVWTVVRFELRNPAKLRALAASGRLERPSRRSRPAQPTERSA